MLQHDQRPTAARRRQHSPRWPSDRRASAERHLAPGRRADVSGGCNFLLHDRPGKYTARDAFARPVHQSVLAADGQLLRGAVTRASRSGRNGRPVGPRVRRPRLRRREARRACDCAGERSKTSADGRTNRRHGAERAHRDDDAHAGTRPAALNRRPLYRAFDGRCLRFRRSPSRSRARQVDRAGNAGRRPQRPGGAKRLLRLGACFRGIRT